MTKGGIPRCRASAASVKSRCVPFGHRLLRSNRYVVDNEIITAAASRRCRRRAGRICRRIELLASMSRGDRARTASSRRPEPITRRCRECHRPFARHHDQSRVCVGVCVIVRVQFLQSSSSSWLRAPRRQLSSVRLRPRFLTAYMYSIYSRPLGEASNVPALVQVQMQWVLFGI